LKSSGQSVGRRMIYGGKDLWNRCVLSLEWKREEVMDCVMFVNKIGSVIVEALDSELWRLLSRE